MQAGKHCGREVDRTGVTWLENRALLSHYLLYTRSLYYRKCLSSFPKQDSRVGISPFWVLLGIVVSQDLKYGTHTHGTH